MAKRDKAGHKTVADHLRESIRNGDNRRDIQKAFGLTVDPELPPTLASLLDAIDQAQKAATQEVPDGPAAVRPQEGTEWDLDGVRRVHRAAG